MSWTDPLHQRFLVVSAVYDNATTLDELQARLASTATAAGLDARFLYVDDGSRDGSWPVIRRLAAEDRNVAGLRLRRNYGQTRALCAGLESGRADVVVYIDADLEIPPESVGLLAPAIAAGHDFVGGARATRVGRGPTRRIGAWVFNALTRALTGLDVRDVGCGLVAMRENVVDAVVEAMRSRPVQIIKPAMMMAAADPIEVPIPSTPAPRSSHSNRALFRFAVEFLRMGTDGLHVDARGSVARHPVNGPSATSRGVRTAARGVARVAGAAARCVTRPRSAERPQPDALYEIDERVGWVAAADVPPSEARVRPSDTRS